MTCRTTIARHFHSLTQVSRDEISGTSGLACAPINLPDDAATMFAGYVGSNYQPDTGLLMLTINPGGGTDKYVSRTSEDEEFYPLLLEFKRAAPTSVISSFERVNSSFVQIVKGWNLWRIMEPTLHAAGRTLDHVAYMNVVPYRTQGDKMPPMAVRRTAWRRLVAPTLKVLRPRAIVTLGKKAGSVVDSLHCGERHLYCVPRTIGDSWVSEDAKAEHMRMRDELG